VNRLQPKDEKKRGKLLVPLLLALCYAAMLLPLSRGITYIGRVVSGHQLLVVENMISNAVVQCYALEGRYPPDIAYMQEHYGIYIDEERYIVHYDSIASNLMPQITVLPNE